VNPGSIAPIIRMRVILHGPLRPSIANARLGLRLKLSAVGRQFHRIGDHCPSY